MGWNDKRLRRELERRGASFHTMSELRLYRRRHPFRRIFLNVFLWGFVSVGIYVFITILTLPSLDSLLRETRMPVITFIDRDGFEIQSKNQIMGDPVSHKNLPKYVWQSILAIEDKRFFHHGAVDMRGIMRSIFANLRLGRVSQGGSSITQQTAKNIFLTNKRTIHRKIQELMMAVWLENRFSKTQILDLYMNRVSLSRGMRGIDAAARDIFSKPAVELTLAESAQIAAMLKAPTTYHPQRNPDKNIARAKIVLAEMLRQGVINQKQYAAAAKQLKKPIRESASVRNDLRYWTDFVMDEVKSRLGDKIETDLFVYTTLDADMQGLASEKLRRKAGKYQGSVVAIDRRGEILLMVGGVDYRESQFNRALAMRQPGSAFKPATYLVALENGMTPRDLVDDSAFAIGDYNPKNYNEKYYGTITLADAFAKSVNSVPLKLTAQFGLDSVLSMAARLGVGSKLRRDYSTVLGASEMSLLDLTTMYAAIWNNGYSIKPFSISKITSPDGRVLYSRTPGDSIKLLHDDTVNYMTELLADVVKNGTGRRAYIGGKTIGGKTGTSSNYRDAWFIGATNRMTMGVWIGNDDFTPMADVTGGAIPADIFKDIISK
ncbi:MAG: PBP1A family penicillin-binding protein [Rickettsiales bacterium]|jgi:penicillin-binding protein 1A|nr:PBP1A family penicillin-binding protein [Rickettsiales bacterium]